MIGMQSIICHPIIHQRVLHSQLSKIGDNGDSEADDGEYRANVRHPSEGDEYWRRVSWGSWVEILGSAR